MSLRLDTLSCVDVLQFPDLREEIPSQNPICYNLVKLKSYNKQFGKTTDIERFKIYVRLYRKISLLLKYIFMQ